jgi:hypothetical protein
LKTLRSILNETLREEGRDKQKSKGVFKNEKNVERQYRSVRGRFSDIIFCFMGL